MVSICPISRLSRNRNYFEGKYRVTEHYNFPVRTDRVGGDEMLRHLAQIANSSALTMSIFLVVPGGTITGTLISRDDWLEEWTAVIRSSGSGGQLFAAALEKIFADAGVYIFDDEFPAKDRPSRLHIQNGFVSTPTGRVGPYLLRVRVDTVSAWSLGAPPSAN